MPSSDWGFQSLGAAGAGKGSWAALPSAKHSLGRPHKHRQVLFALKAEIKLVDQGDFAAFKEKLLPCLHLPLWRSVKVQSCRGAGPAGWAAALGIAYQPQRLADLIFFISNRSKERQIVHEESHSINY